MPADRMGIAFLEAAGGRWNFRRAFAVIAACAHERLWMLRPPNREGINVSIIGIITADACAHRHFRRADHHRDYIGIGKRGARRSGFVLPVTSQQTGISVCGHGTAQINPTGRRSTRA